MDDQGSRRYFTVERRPGRVYICCLRFITYYHTIKLARTHLILTIATICCVASLHDRVWLIRCDAKTNWLLGPPGCRHALIFS